MMTEMIDPRTQIGAVHLNCADLERLASFYQNVLGFRLLRREGNSTWLGAGRAEAIAQGRALLILTQVKDGQRRQGTTGLYHFAVLVPSRRELASLIVRATQAGAAVEGFADHGVSEALYLADPEGNGVEIYRDRPRQEWPVDATGRLRMVTEPLNLDEVLAELKGDSISPSGLSEQTRIGHVHLHVTDLQAAEQFYCGVLGFERMQRYGSRAIFVSAGGYHHHVGLNTWVGVGAPSPPPETPGLRWFSILLPDGEQLEAIAERIRAAKLALSQHSDGYLLQDPSQNGILLTITPN
jgi:catechol 2,3-dioxygenase